MAKTIILAKRPDIVVLLEKYALLPLGGGIKAYEGIAKKWAQEGTPPYDNPEYRALARRLVVGWEAMGEEEFNTLLQDLQKVILQKKQHMKNTPNKGSEKNFKALSHVSFLALAYMASFLVGAGIGHLPDVEEKEKQRAKEFSFELIIHLTTGAALLERVFETIANTIVAKRKNQKLIGELLKMGAVFLSILAASNGEEEHLKRTLFSLKKSFEGLEKIGSFLSQQLAKETTRSKKAENCALFLQQAKIALEKEDFEAFYAAFTGVLKSLQLVPGDFIDDVKQSAHLANRLRQIIEDGLDQVQATAMSQAM